MVGAVHVAVDAVVESGEEAFTQARLIFRHILITQDNWKDASFLLISINKIYPKSENSRQNQQRILQELRNSPTLLILATVDCRSFRHHACKLGRRILLKCGGLSKEAFEPKVKICFMRNIFLLVKVTVRFLVLMHCKVALRTFVAPCPLDVKPCITSEPKI